MKKILALLLALCMIFSLAACGDKAEEPKEDTSKVEQKAEEPTTEPEADAGDASFTAGSRSLPLGKPMA